MNDRERAAAAASRLFDEHRAGERFTGLPADLRPRSLEEAHAVQDCLQRLNEEHGLGPLAGWKVALTTPVMQRLAGIDHPCAGRHPRGVRVSEPGHPEHPRLCPYRDRGRDRGAPVRGSRRRGAHARFGGRRSGRPCAGHRDRRRPGGRLRLPRRALAGGRQLLQLRHRAGAGDRGLDGSRSARGARPSRDQRRGGRRGRRQRGDGASVRGARLARQRPRVPRARASGRRDRHDRQHRRDEVAFGRETRSSSTSTSSGRSVSALPDGASPRRRGRGPMAAPVRTGTSRAARTPRRTATSRPLRSRT